MVHSTIKLHVERHVDFLGGQDQVDLPYAANKSNLSLLRW